jgi:phosphoesterase RecJ-like protein
MTISDFILLFLASMENVQLEGLEYSLNAKTKVVIIGHRNPDGDAVGSTLGLKLYFDKKGVPAEVILPNDYPDFLKWLPGNDQVHLYEVQKDECDRMLTDADLIFTLDFNDLSRVGDELHQKLKTSSADFVLIDHHQQPMDFAKYLFTDDEKCSTCELVYDLIDHFGDNQWIDASIASNLYTGIMTDTGSFKYASTTSDTHRVIADLIDAGARNDQIHKKTFDVNSLNRLQLLGLALSRLEKLVDHKVAFIHLSRKDLEDHDFKKGDTEGFVNYALSIKDVELAAIFIEDMNEDYVKLSLRSKNDFNVNEFAREHFNGGGHINAAGGRCDRQLEDCIAYFKETLTQYPALQCVP